MRVRFSLRQLMGLVTFVAVACTGLLHPSTNLASAVFTATMMLMVVAVLGAVGRRGSARFFWIGFAVAGWGYLWLAHWPDEDDYLFERSWQLQTAGPLLSTKLLNLAFMTLHGEPDGGGGGGGFMSLSAETEDDGSFEASGLGFSDESRPALDPEPEVRFQFGGSSGSSVGNLDSMRSAFMRIGHSLWALVLAYLGGLLTRRFHEIGRPGSRNIV